MIVVAGLAVAGALIGALWAWIAPPIHGVVALTRSGERVRAYLGNEADHFFIAAFLIVGMLSVLAVVAAVLVWQWRAHRGPVMVAALSVGAAAAGGRGGGRRVRCWCIGATATIDVAAAPISPEHRVHYVTEAPAGVLRALAAADRRDDPVSRGGRGAGLRADRGVDVTRRPGRLAAGGGAGARLRPVTADDAPPSAPSSPSR